MFVSPHSVRTLNALEEIFHVVDQVNPFNFTVFAEVSGPMHLDALRMSLTRQMRRFPILQARIESSEQGLIWVRHDVPPRVDMVSGGTLADQLANQLNTPFASDDAYIRLRWHREKAPM